MSAKRVRSWPSVRADVSSWAWLGASYGLSAAFSFAYVALAGRRLGPAAAADFYSGLFAIYLLGMLVWPIGGAISRTTGAAIAVGHGGMLPVHQRRVHCITLAGAVVIASLAATAVPALSRALELGSSAPLLVALATGVVLAVLAVDRGFLRGAGDFRAFSTSQVAESSLRLVFGMAALVRWPTASAALAAYLPACAGAWLLARRQVTRLGERLAPSTTADEAPPSGATHDTWRWVLPLLAVAVAEAGYQNLDPLVAKATLAGETSGAYGAAAALARTFGILASPFVATALPDASGAWARGGGVLRSFARTATAFLCAAAVPLLACLVLPVPIVTVVLGSAFAESATLLPTLALAWVAGCLALVAAQALVASGRLAFLPFYVGGVAVEAWFLPRVGPDALALARITLAIKAALLIVLVGLLVLSRRGEPRASAWPSVGHSRREQT